MHDTSPFPEYLHLQQQQQVQNFITVLLQSEIELIPKQHQDKFIQQGKITIYSQKSQKTYCNPKQAQKILISKQTSLKLSKGITKLNNYYGIASDLLSSAYYFTRKKDKSKLPTIWLPEMLKFKQIQNLSEAKNRTKQWANGRGDIQGVPQYFQNICIKLAKQLGVKLTVIKGDQLLEEGFRLMHTVGRASVNQPIFINLAYNGNQDCEQWVSYVGKGVCFDTGGINIKSTAGMKPMFLDKHGACSVLSAFQTIVQEKIKINLTVSMGFVENSISKNSYRPSDIIKSRKGLTVQITDTDAEGRLVLADCMDWTQQKFKTSILIELSTLTYISIVLGSRHAGVFSNSDILVEQISKAGQQVNQLVWRLPVLEYHHNLIKSEVADIASDPEVGECEAAKGAAFLQNFVVPSTQWVHMDIGGTALVNDQGTGFGTKLLIQFARNYHYY